MDACSADACRRSARSFTPSFAHEPTRPKAGRAEKRGPGQWKEAKGVRCYLALPDDRIVQLASWHQIQDAEAMRRNLASLPARIPQAEVRIALLGDGAPWVRNSLTEAFPTGRQILDYYHCKQHLYAVANAHYDDTPRGVHWVEATLVRLGEDRVSAVIAGLRRMQSTTIQAAGRKGDRRPDHLPRKSAGWFWLRRLQGRGHAHRKRWYRIRKQVHWSRPPQAPRRLVGGRERPLDTD